MEKSAVAVKAVRRPFYRRDPLTSISLVALVFLASQIAAGVLIAIYPAFKNWTADQGADWLQTSVVAQFIYILLAELFAVWLIFKLLNRAKIAKARIGIVKPALKDILYAAAGYLVYLVTLTVIVALITMYTNFLNTDQPQDIGFDGAAGSQLYLVFLSLVVLPPIAEEIMFRGFLFSSLRQKFRFRYAVIATSVLFGIAHLQFGNGAPLLWTAAIDTFILSCVLCYLREKTGSLWPSILLHALKNCIAFFVLFRLKF